MRGSYSGQWQSAAVWQGAVSTGIVLPSVTQLRSDLASPHGQNSALLLKMLK